MPIGLLLIALALTAQPDFSPATRPATQVAAEEGDPAIAAACDRLAGLWLVDDVGGDAAGGRAVWFGSDGVGAGGEVSEAGEITLRGQRGRWGVESVAADGTARVSLYDDDPARPVTRADAVVEQDRLTLTVVDGRDPAGETMMFRRAPADVAERFARALAEAPPAAGGEEAKAVAARVDIASLGLALSMFEIEIGRYPTAAEGLAALAEAPAGVPDWSGPYVQEVPVDPWGRPYAYAGAGDDGYPIVYCLGPDGVDGTEDDITSGD